MGIYYTVDRSRDLEPGSRLVCNHELSNCRMFPMKEHFDRADIEALAKAEFPNGLSPHGKRYFLDEPLVISTSNGPAPYAPHIPIIELVVELIRRLEFPDHPSRYESLFAWETPEDATSFRDSYCAGEGNLLRVEAECAGRYDMNQLFLGGTTSGSWMFARRYWNGVASARPCWEVLLRLPASVIEVVDE